MKKKLLALLLTIMMVAILIPAVVVSALVPSSLDDGAGDAAPDERAEVATHEPLLEEDNVEVFNKDGVRVGYYATLAAAVAELRNGDTVSLLEDLTETETVILSGVFTLKGNGFVTVCPIRVVGNGTDIEIQNLVAMAPDAMSVIAVEPQNATDVTELTLTNCRVTGTRLFAVRVMGLNASLTIKGLSGSYHGNWYAVDNQGGFVDIYGGTFTSNIAVIASATYNNLAASTTAIYGGTFEALGNSNGEVIYAYGGSTVVLAGGEYTTARGDDAMNLLNSESDSSIYVLDGKYYLANASDKLINGEGVKIYGGYFYGQTEVELSSDVIVEPYAVKAYTYEDPTFPANTKLESVKALGYYFMQQVTYDEAWLSANGYTATAYEVTNGVYNENPASYYAFELERAYLYLGNNGSLTLTGDAEYTSDSALCFRNRPKTSEITLKSAAVGTEPYALRAHMDDNYLLVATGGTYHVANVALINEAGPAILLDRDNTDAEGCVLNLQKGASVAGYDGHSIWIGAYATVNMYSGAYVHAAAGADGSYNGTGLALLTMVGGTFNMYGGSLGYARVAGDNGSMMDMVCTGSMSTVYVGVDEAASTCVSKINIYGGRLGKSGYDNSNPTALLNLAESSELIDGTKIYIEDGEFNASLNNIIRAGKRNIDIHIKGGVFNGPTARCSSANHSDLILVDGESTEVRNRLVIEGGTFSGGRDQLSICGYALVSVSDSYHTGAMSSVFACHGNADSPVNVTDVTVESAVHAFWCNGSAINVTGGTFVVKGAEWTRSAFAVEGDAATAGDINIVGGTYSVSAGYFVNIAGLAQRTVTVTDSEFNSIGGSCFCMNTEGRADLVVNSGTFSNMYGGSHQIETWGDPTKTLGSVTINGGSFVRGGNASGRMIKFYGGNNVIINGGYFHSQTSETIVIEKSGDRTFAPTLTLTINGGTFYNKRDNTSVIFMNSSAEANLVINGGEFINEGPAASRSWQPCLDVNGKGSTNIYGGSFTSIAPAGTNGSDACVTVGDSICNIYAGTFRSNGMCVVRGLAGSTDGEYNVDGKIKTAANSRLNIYGGVFTLEKNETRTSQNCTHDAVVRCGGGSTYAFVSIYGGTFIDNSTCSDRVISKNNVHSSISITGGVFLASSAQEYYYQSSGKANTGCTEFPAEPYAKSYSDPKVNHGGKEYHQLVVGTGSSPFNGEMEEGAQIRIAYDGESYQGGLRFASYYTPTASAALKGMAGDDMDKLTFGTLIIRTELLSALYSFSHAALAQAGIEDYVDVVAVEGVSGSVDTGYTVTAALSNITAENYETSYSAVGYAMVELADGNQVYFYTDFDEEKNSRSLTQVAQAALADVSDDQTKGYVYAHVTMEGKFSRYTTEQQNVLLSYIATPEADE